jgi:hypothetical protein
MIAPAQGLLPIRASYLNAMAKSPAHCRHVMSEDDEKPESYRQKGSALHSIVLGGQKVLTWHKGRPRRGKEYEQFQADNPDAIILTHSEYEPVMRMVEAIWNHPLAMEHVTRGLGNAEQTLHWEYLGRQCRITPDLRCSTELSELKTSKCADPERFRWDALRYGYHVQLAFYRMGCATLGLADQDAAATIICVESARPHPVTVLRLTPNALDVGERLVRLHFERLLQCEAASEWPPYSQSVVPLDVPAPDDEDDMPELVFGDEEDAA